MATILLPPVKLPALYKIPVDVSLVAEADAPELIKQPNTVPPLVIENVNAVAVFVVMLVGVVPPLVAADQDGAWRFPVYAGALDPPTSIQPVWEEIVSEAT